MVECEAKRGQRLAAARGHGQREEARRQRRLRTDMRQHLGPQQVQVGLGRERRHMRIEGRAQPRQQALQGRPAPVRRAPLKPGVEGFGIAEIRIDETGEDHPPGHRQVERAVLVRPQLGDEFGNRRRQIQHRGGGDRGVDGVAEPLDPALHIAFQFAL